MTTWVLKLLQVKVGEGRVGGQKGSGAQGLRAEIGLL